MAEKLLHYWEKYNIVNIPGCPAYKCSWCGLTVRVPLITQRMKSIKVDDDNFDITCALVQGKDRDTKQYREIWECPIDGESRKKINVAYDEAERIIAEKVMVTNGN